MAKSSKHLRLMGLTASSLLADAMNRGGYLKNAECQIFWEQVSSIREGTEFLNDMLVRLRTTLLAEADGSNDSSGGGGGGGGAGGPTSVLSTNSIVQTLNFIALFVQFNKADRRVLRSLKAFQEDKTLGGVVQRQQGVREVLRSITHLLEGTDTLGSQIIATTTLHSVEDFRKLADWVRCPTLVDSEIASGESSFLYQRLRDVALASPDVELPKLLETLSNKLLTLPQQMRMNPLVAETTLLALVHIIRQFLAMRPVVNTGVLKRATATASQFYLWPEPYGSATERLLLDLRTEAAWPGASLRAMFELEGRHAEIAGSRDACSQRARPAYYFHEAEDVHGAPFLKMINMEPIDEDTHCARFSRPSLSATSQALLLMAMLHADTPLTDADTALFRKLSVSQVGELYQRCQAAERASFQLKPEAAREERLKVLRQVKADVGKLAASAKPPLVQLPAQLPRGFLPPLPPIAHVGASHGTGYTHMTPGQRKLMCINYLPYPSTPCTDLVEKIMEAHASRATAGKKSVAAGSEAAAAAALARKASAAALSRSPSGASGILSGSSSLADLSFGDGSEPNGIGIRFVVAGGNSFLHSFLCSYLHVLQAHPSWAGVLHPQFFLIPLARNHVASYVARCDSWYNRHVYTPFRSPAFVIPWVASEPAGTAEQKKDAEMKKDEIASGLTPPGRVLRASLENYMREARHRMDISVFGVQCWKFIEGDESGADDASADDSAGGGDSGGADDEKKEAHELLKSASAMSSVSDLRRAASMASIANSEAGGRRRGPGLSRLSISAAPDEDVPFIQRMEIGLVADARDYQARRGLPKSLPFKDLIGAKGFQFNPPDLRVIFTKVDLDGCELATIADTGCAFASIILSHVPRKADRCFPPDPTATWLEMFARPTESSRTKQRLRKNVLLNDPQQHVSKVTIETVDPNQTFLIRLDDTNFGPYRRVTVRCLTGDTGLPVRFPVATFFPKRT